MSDTMAAPIFYYDFSSPYSYLAAARIDSLIPAARWQPIAFGALIGEIAKRPWSLGADRQAHFDEISRRAAARGLRPVRWPPGWPAESYSVLPLRAALVAEEQGRLKALSHALYAATFVHGRRLDDLDHVLDAGEEAGIDREGLRAGAQRPEIKQRLRANTDEALRRGVSGVPTVALDGALFWGDDRLEDAAKAAVAQGS